MQNNFATGGGGKKPSPELIAIRTKHFVEKRWFRVPSRLTPQQRSIVAYCLSQFNTPPGQIASIISVSVRTVYNDIAAAEIEKNRKQFLEKVQELRAYILYNAVYIP